MLDPISLIAGAIVAVGLAILIFTQRGRLAALRSSAQQQVATTRARLSRGIDARYRDAVIDLANSWHIAGHLVALEQVAVVPRFYTLREPRSPHEEEIPTGIEVPYELLPLTPEWPQAIAPYQMPGIPIEQLLRGQDHLALLGLPGSGRTAALALIAILVTRQTEDRQAGGLLDLRRLPILLHLADLDLSPEILGSVEVDPLLPLLNAASLRLRGLIGHMLAAIQGQFAAGNGLILADGWDELPPDMQQQVTEWLRVLIETYPENKVVVTGPVRGYGPLQELGLAPVFMMPWSNAEFGELARLWAEAWPETGGTAQEPASSPSTEMIRRAMRDCRARSPLDVTLKTWATFAGDDPAQGRRGWYSAYINRVTPAPELRGAIERIGEADVLRPEELGITLEEANTLVDAARNALDQRPAISTPDYIYAITNQTHILTERVSGYFTFTQPAIGAYLAAESLRQEAFREALLGDSILHHLAMTFLAQMRDISAYVEQRLGEKSTILRERLLPLAAWAADADPGAAWRGPVFKQIAQLLLSPAEFPTVREQAMAVLAASRDRNVGYIFRQGLKSHDSSVRILSALGLGALGDPETVVPLGETLADRDPTVEAAAALGLGAISTKAALDYMLQALLSGGELARRAVADMLAVEITGEGSEILREALEEQDPATRRAAVYALERVNQDWVMEKLKQVETRDDQWVVRAAASTVLETLRDPPNTSPRHTRQPEEIDWLIQWLAARDENVQPGTRGIRQIIRALQEGDVKIRQAAAETLGALAPSDGITPLYAALRDAEAEVRDTAYRALGAVSRATGQALPGVTA